jgi:hypothetical protein
VAEERFERLLSWVQAWLDARLVEAWRAKRIKCGIAKGTADG